MFACGATAVLILATLLAQHCDFKQLDQRGRSGTRKDLRVWIIDRYTQVGHATASHANVDTGHMINCLNNHVEEVVVKGWYQLFKIIEGIFGLVFSILTVMYLTTKVSADGDVVVEWRIALAIFPALLTATYAARSREAENLRLAEIREEQETGWISLANEVMNQSDAIKQYAKQEHVVKEFKTNYEQFYKDHRKHRKFELGTTWKCHWYNGIIYYSLLALGPCFIISTGVMSPSKFVVVIKLFSKIDKYIVGLLQSFSAIQRASIALEQIRGVLNLPTGAHEVGAVHKSPQYGDSERWSAYEIFSLCVFMFCNGSNPNALPAPALVAAAAEKATAATKQGIEKINTISAKSIRRMSSFSGGMLGATVSPTKHSDAKGSYAPTRSSPVDSSAIARADSFVVDHHDKSHMAQGTGDLFKWVFMQTSLTVFDHIHLHDVQLKMQRPGDAHGSLLLDNVDVQLPLGMFYAVKGKLPQAGKGIGRGIFLEMLCGMRLADRGVVGLPPQLRSVMLTSNDTQFFDHTVEECLLWGNPNPEDVPEKAIKAACKLSGLADSYVDDFEEARKHRMLRCSCFDEDDPHRPGRRRLRCRFKVGKGGRHIRVVDRAAMAVARAMLADVDMIVINRTESTMCHERTQLTYKSLRRWVDEGVPGMKTSMVSEGNGDVQMPRLRTVSNFKRQELFRCPYTSSIPPF